MDTTPQDEQESKPSSEFWLIPPNFLSSVEGRRRAIELLTKQEEEFERKLLSVRTQIRAEALCLNEVIYDAFPDKELPKKHWHVREQKGSLGVCVHHNPPIHPLQQIIDMLGGDPSQPTPKDGE